MKGIHQSPVESSHNDQWRGTLMFCLICTWTNDWANNWDAGNLRRHRAHYYVTVMSTPFCRWDRYTLDLAPYRGYWRTGFWRGWVIEVLVAVEKLWKCFYICYVSTNNFSSLRGNTTLLGARGWPLSRRQIQGHCNNWKHLKFTNISIEYALRLHDIDDECVLR